MKGTAKRQEEMRQTRRRKKGSNTQLKQNLAVDESALDRENFEYRWVNDDGMRVQELHGQDWDKVDVSAALDSDGLGSVQEHMAGKDSNGKPFKAVLMKKRKDWYEEDRRERQQQIDKVENDLRRGSDTSTRDAALAGEDTYTPGGTNIIE